MTPDVQPVPPPEAPRKRRRWIWWLLGVLLVLLLTIVGGLAWLLATTNGARFALNTGLEQSGGTGVVDGVQGTLLDGLTI